jgi:Leucine rich repeat
MMNTLKEVLLLAVSLNVIAGIWLSHIVQVLLLAGNRLVALQPMTFRTLFSLRSLDLSDNPITSLHSDLLAASRRLVEFSAAGTHLRQLTPGLFRHSSALAVVDLSRCSFMSPPDRQSIASLFASSNFTMLRLGRRACDCEHFRSLVSELQAVQRPFPIQLFCDNVDVSAVTSYCSSSPTPPASLFRGQSPPWIGASQTPASVGSREPLPYDPMLGWYTAAVLSGLLFAFIACVWLEKAEKQLMEACLHNRQKRKQRNSPPINSMVDDPVQRAASAAATPIGGDGDFSRNCNTATRTPTRPDTDERSKKVDGYYVHTRPTET